jgi:putative addiction module killer protein
MDVRLHGCRRLNGSGDKVEVVDNVRNKLSSNFQCRIYFGEHGNTLVVLLCGGDKSNQDSAFQKALRYWKDYKSDA